MKKFGIKSMLVLVLALVLVCSLVLVACGEKKDGGNSDNPNPTPTPGPTPVTYTAKEYFTRLWDLSKNIGNEEIKDNQNIAVSADLGVELAIKTNDKANVTKKQIGLGFAIDAVLDRTNVRTDEEIKNGTFNNKNVGKDTALKVKVYDSTTGENWVTIYYFMSDPGKLFLDYAGQNIIVAFDYANDQLGSWLSKTIFEDQTMIVYDQEKQNGYVYDAQTYYYVAKDNEVNGVEYKVGMYEGTAPEGTNFPTYYKGHASIGAILGSIAKTMGDNWDLNTLVNDVFTLIKRATESQMNLVEIVGGFASMVAEENEIYVDPNTKDKINLAGILTSAKLANTLFGTLEAPKTDEATGVTTYTAPIKMTGLVGNALSGFTAPLITSSSKLSLEFTEKDNKIQSFAIKADLNNLATNDKEYPALKVSINSLKIRGVDSGKTESVVKMPVERNKYSTEVALDAKIALDIDGITINPAALENRNNKLSGMKSIALDGQLVVAFNGKLDLANADNNGTKANAVVSFKAKGAKAAVPFLQASFIKDTLALKLNQDLTIDDVPVAQALVGAFGGYVFDMVKGLPAFQSDPTALNQFADVFFAKNSDNTTPNTFALNPEFKGAVWTGMDVVPAFQKAVNKIVEMLGGKGLVKASTQALPLKAIANTITKVIPYFTTGADGLTITAENVNAVVAKIGSEFDPNMTEDGNVTSITKWDNGNWIPDIAALLAIAGAKYNTDSAKNAIAFEDKDVEVYKNAEREKYAFAYYVVTDDRVAAAREVYAGKDDAYIRKALASEDFKAYANTTAIKNKHIAEERAKYESYMREQLGDKYDGLTPAQRDKWLVKKAKENTDIVLNYIGKKDSELKAGLEAELAKLLADIDAAILAAKESGNSDITAIRFIGKETNDIKNLVKADKAFIGEILSASATVRVSMSGTEGFVLAINAKVADANVGISFSIGASEVKQNTFVDYAPADTTETGWFRWAF